MLGTLIGGGLKLIGGLLGQKSQQKAVRQQMEEQRAYAQHGIQWRVNDARRAGVHPLVALGANTHSYSPQSIGEDPMQRAVEGMGQDLSRAVDARMGAGKRARVYQEAAQKLNLEHMDLRNDLLRSQIMRINQAGQGPGVPTDGVVPSRRMVPAGHKETAPRFTPHYKAGGVIMSNPYVTDAETIEQRHGDLAGSLWGAVTVPSDFYYNGHRRLMRYGWYRRSNKGWRRIMKGLRR